MPGDPFLAQLAALRILAIIRAPSSNAALEIGVAVARGGIGALEVTFTTPGAADAIAALTARLPGVVIGAGTVLDRPTLEAARAAGAAFAVSPHLDLELVAAARELGVPYLPGALTPTEVLAAWRGGATAIKLFPAAQVGPSYLAALRGPFPGVPIVPTGGVDEQNVAAWLAAGAVAVGIGGSLVRGDPATIEAQARRLLLAAGRAPGG